MKLATLFRLKENLNLDRKTLVTLRWIALIGQFAAINIVFFILGLDFPNPVGLAAGFDEQETLPASGGLPQKREAVRPCGTVHDA